jgi:hypothetical protein
MLLQFLAQKIDDLQKAVSNQAATASNQLKAVSLPSEMTP